MTKSKNTKPNVRLLRRIEKHILAEPRRLNMLDWNSTHRDYRQDGEQPPCKTVGCIAGWAANLMGRKPKTQRGFAKIGCELLNIDGYDHGINMLRYDSPARRLFIVDAWPKSFRDKYLETEGTYAGPSRFEKRANLTAARIEHFIKTGK